jgi:hypothetical protein
MKAKGNSEFPLKIRLRETIIKFQFFPPQRDLNRRPLTCQLYALPTEPRFRENDLQRLASVYIQQIAGETK